MGAASPDKAIMMNPGEVLAGMGRSLGIYSRDEIHSDIQISSLLTPDFARQSAKRNIIRTSGGSTEIYQKSMFSFKQNYRRKYSKKFIENAGYNPTTTAAYRVINNTSLIQEIPSAIEIISVRDGYMTDDELARWKMQTMSGGIWSNVDSSFIETNGDIFRLKTIVPTAQDEVTLKTRLDEVQQSTRFLQAEPLYEYDSALNTVALYTGSDNKIINRATQALTDNVQVDVFDSSDILMSSNNPTVSSSEWTLDTGVLNSGDYYINVVEKQGSTVLTSYRYDFFIGAKEIYDIQLPYDNVQYDNNGIPSYRIDVVNNGNQVEIFAPITLKDYVVSDAQNQTLSLISKYKKDSTNEYFYYIVTAGTLNVYTDKILDMTAIITLKENNTIVDLASGKLKRMLRKINLEADILVDSLNNDDMDSAYLMSGINPAETNQSCLKVLFKIFHSTDVGDKESFSVNIDKLNMKYSYDSTSSVHSGVVGSVGSYIRTMVGDVLTIQFQGSETQYQQVIVEGYQQIYTISGQTMNAGINSGSQYARMLIPLDIMNSLKYKDFEAVYERSLCLLAYSTQVVHIKWYETGAFAMILKIIAIIVIIIVSIWDWSGTTQAGIWAAVSAITMQQVVGFVINLVIAFGISMVVSAIAKSVGGVLGVVLGVIAGIVMTYYGFGTEMFSNDMWLQAINMTLSTTSEMLEHEMAMVLEMGEEFQKEMASKFSDLEELAEKYANDAENGTGMFDMFQDFATSGNPEFMSTSDYVSSIVNGGKISDWLYDVSMHVERKKQVVVAGRI